MNTRARMRLSNRRAEKYLLENGYDQIWLKKHFDPRKKYGHDLVYFNKRGSTKYGQRESDGANYYVALDLFNLFDGMCFSPDGRLVFIQIKTNSWPSEKPILDFISDKQGFAVIAINVKQKEGRWSVITRHWNTEGLIVAQSRNN